MSKQPGVHTTTGLGFCTFSSLVEISIQILTPSCFTSLAFSLTGCLVRLGWRPVRVKREAGQTQCKQLTLVLLTAFSEAFSSYIRLVNPNKNLATLDYPCLQSNIICDIHSYRPALVCFQCEPGPTDSTGPPLSPPYTTFPIRTSGTKKWSGHSKLPFLLVLVVCVQNNN